MNCVHTFRSGRHKRQADITCVNAAKQTAKFFNKKKRYSGMLLKKQQHKLH